MPNIKNAIEKHLSILKQVRSKEIDTAVFHYAEAQDNEGMSYDRNHEKRLQLLIALRLDPAATDEPLLQEMLKQEIIMHKNATLQGLNDSLRMNAHLLARFKNPRNVWLFTEAKAANFDTFCGFDYEYLVSGGIIETYNVVATSEHPLKTGFYDYMGDTPSACEVDEEQLENWRNFMSTYYKSPDEFIDIEDEIYLMLELSEYELLGAKVVEWKQRQTSWDKERLTMLSNFERMAKNLPGEIWANEQLLSTKDNAWDIASQLKTLSSLYLKNNDPYTAWKRIKLAFSYKNEIGHWPNIGLAWFIIEAAFDIALQIRANENDIVQEIFSLFMPEVHELHQPGLNLLAKVIETCTLMGDTKNETHFKAILSAKQKELDDLMKDAKK